MARVKVSCAELTAYGNFLEEKSKEFKAITSQMESIVSSLDSSWSGYDATNFKNNATNYIKNLQSIEGAFVEFGDSIRKKSADYNNIRANFFDILNG